MSVAKVMIELNADGKSGVLHILTPLYGSRLDFSEHTRNEVADRDGTRLIHMEFQIIDAVSSFDLIPPSLRVRMPDA